MVSEQGTIASFSLAGTDVAEGEDYMLIDIPETEAAPAEVSSDFVVHPNLTKETLDTQLEEMEKIMASRSLGAKPGLGSPAKSETPPSGLCFLLLLPQLRPSSSLKRRL